MIEKLIMVGATTQNNKLVNGQSMMFQLFVDQLQDRNITTVIVDFGKSVNPQLHKNRVSGKFDFSKLVDNFFLIFRFIFVILSNPRTPVYINTSQSKVGFVRDYIFINFAKLFKRKIIVHQFGANYTRFYNSQSYGNKIKIKNTLEKADLIIVEGDFTKEQFGFLTDYKWKVVSVTNGLPERINGDKILPKRIIGSDPVELFYLSNLIEGKGYWDVLEAVNILVNQDKRNVRAVFAGRFLEDVEDKRFSSSAEAREQFNKFIEKNNLQDSVTYLEGLYGAEKSVAFQKARFFLLPTYYINEGQPVSILEALAYGCVPIVTAYRLIPDMVTPKNGFFVKPQSPAEIAKVINLMIENPEDYEAMSAAGITHYKANFTAEKYVEKLASLINSVSSQISLH